VSINAVCGGRAGAVMADPPGGASLKPGPVPPADRRRSASGGVIEKRRKQKGPLTLDVAAADSPTDKSKDGFSMCAPMLVLVAARRPTRQLTRMRGCARGGGGERTTTEAVRACWRMGTCLYPRRACL
jgi:hypothetical protein